jgi:hypothetical protein
MNTKYLRHRHGGTITEISAIAHESYKGVASWHFVGDVQWDDGTKSCGTTIAPFCVCFNQDNPLAKAEGDGLFAQLSDYLTRNGAWHDTKRARDGRVYTWTPNSPAAQMPLGVTA